MKNRYRGALLGLAAGDALGTTVEFKQPGTFTLLTTIVGGGPFNLKPGEWTDDTSMALCLAESLVVKRGFDQRDQMERYVEWRDHGHYSVKGYCFDCGVTVGAALGRYKATGNPVAGSTLPNTAGNGSLMRLAPVPLAYARHPVVLEDRCDASSVTTHGAYTCVSACRFYGSLIAAAVNGATKDQLLATPILEYQRTLHGEVADVAAGSYKDYGPPAIKGTGYVVDSLEAALWAFHNSNTFREGALLAANLGQDADTTAAVYGQLAGAYYGISGIPRSWRQKIAMRGTIIGLADGLYALAHSEELR